MKSDMRVTRPYLKSQKIIRKRKRRAYRRIVLFILFIVLIIGALVCTTHLQAFTIQTITVAGNDITPSDQITQLVQNDLQGSYEYIFPKHNILLYPRATIEQDIKNKFPRVSSVAISTDGLTAIKVFISERQATSLWCMSSDQVTVSSNAQTAPTTIAASSTLNETATSSLIQPIKKIQQEQQTIDQSATSDNQCYFIDGSGYVFSLAPDVQGDAYIKYYGGAITGNPIGQEILASSTFASLTQLVDQMNQNNLPISFVTIQDENDFALRLQNNGNILFANDRPFSDELNNLLAALTSDVFVNPNDTSVPKKIAQFEYIDTRFGDKVFFKLKSISATNTSKSIVRTVISTTTATTTKSR